jgi:hypothetical protein
VEEAAPLRTMTLEKAVLLELQQAAGTATLTQEKAVSVEAHRGE